MRLLKSVVWNPKASSFDKREVEELCKVDSEFKKLYEAEMAVKKQQDDEAAAQLKEKEEERLRAERAEREAEAAREAKAASEVNNRTLEQPVNNGNAGGNGVN